MELIQLSTKVLLVPGVWKQRHEKGFSPHSMSHQSFSHSCLFFKLVYRSSGWSSLLVFVLTNTGISHFLPGKNFSVAFKGHLCYPAIYSRALFAFMSSNFSCRLWYGWFILMWKTQIWKPSSDLIVLLRSPSLWPPQMPVGVSSWSAGSCKSQK